VNGRAIRWEHIDEVEVVIAPHIGGASGWFVKKFIFRNEERYHVGIYYGSHEAILPNITWDMAKHVLRTIAFYAPQPIKYSGPEDLTPLTEI
jgi:hypothetical protein